MDSFFNYLEKIDKRYPVWDLSLFFILIYLPILQRVYMELSIAYLLTLIIAGITAVIAFITYKVAVKSHEASKQAVKLSKLQLTAELCLKLYELKDYIDIKENTSGLLLLDFYSLIIDRDEYIQKYGSLISSIKDNARASILDQRLSEKLVNVCDFILKDSDSRLELTINEKVETFSPKELFRVNTDSDNPNIYFQALHKNINETVLKAIKELKH
ncbi:hypothetical protein [Pseudoalteromonas sp. SR43-5]|uniref:hypothetical protein n=1 Tax=Pseudoalteromonas sp. SR43-5 TaxID=2760941 RepID=UPI0015F8B3B0|nr:hypothetical protein [Pseudoalteromonas sp. SR43-5]MBB1307769.1 hypothetical protein [Pseudoalteromonas sp. SR43-5]